MWSETLERILLFAKWNVPRGTLSRAIAILDWNPNKLFHVEHPLAASFVVESARL
jgi:hypothetical protein